MSTVIGIDVGTQSVKVIAYNALSKEVQASATSPLSLHQDSLGTAEQSAAEWLSALADCFNQIPANIKQQVVAVGVSGQQHGFVPLNSSGEVIAPVKLWCDTATVNECEALITALGGEQDCIAKLGNLIVPGYTAPKVLWLKKNKPDVFKQLDTILLPHDYINFHLSGVKTMEFGDASGTGLLNVRTREWDASVLAAIDSEKDMLNCLPAFNQPMHISQATADLYGLPEGVVVSAGGGDNMMAAIGTGNVSEGIVTISLGSSGTVYAYSNSPIIDKDQRLAAFCSSTGGWLPLLCMMNCTLSTELTRDLFNINLAELDGIIQSAPLGSAGVLTLPFFNGERSPNIPNAKGSVFGLTSENYSSQNLMRSAMEGVCFGLRLGVEALKDNGVSVTEIRLTGGGGNSAAWRQMLADVCATPVQPVVPDEGAAFGAALQALGAVHEGKALVDICAEHLVLNVENQTQPIQENVKQYNQVYAEYSRAVSLVTEFYKK